MAFGVLRCRLPFEVFSWICLTKMAEWSRRLSPRDDSGERHQADLVILIIWPRIICRPRSLPQDLLSRDHRKRDKDVECFVSYLPLASASLFRIDPYSLYVQLVSGWLKFEKAPKQSIQLELHTAPPITPIRLWQREQRLSLSRGTLQSVCDAKPADDLH